MASEQVHMKPYQDKKDNAGIVAKLNELIEHLSWTHWALIQERHVISIQKQVVGFTARCNQLQQANIRITDHLTNMEVQSHRNILLMDCVPESQGESYNKCKALQLDILDDIMKV